MKKYRFSSIIALASLAGASVLWTACSDAWDDHYGIQEGGMADQPSLLENIAADPALSNFYRVVQAIGVSDALSSPQQLTVWAPLGLTATQADSIIDVYEMDKAAGVKYEDNKAITQFLHNHIALYARSVSSLTDDTVSMLNKKYMRLVGTSASAGKLNENPFNEMVLCNNGILYKTDRVQTFFPNIRQYLEQNSSMDSLVSFIHTYDEYELDEAASVPGGVVDGKTVYLDSVTILSNNLLRMYGYIQREDSVYTILAPTDNVWQQLYDRYAPYYQYSDAVNNKDSLRIEQIRTRIFEGRVFNTSPDWKYNLSPEDSLCNTQYFERQQHNPRQNVYYHPQSGILAGLQKVECSNGFVYIDDRGVIDPHTTFFGRQDYEAASPRYYKIPTDNKNQTTMNVSSRILRLYAGKVDEEGNVISDESRYKDYSYLEVTAKSSTAHTSIEYTLPRTLSGCYYNVYVVTVPNTTNNLPMWFQVGYAQQRQNGTFPGSTGGSDNVTFTSFSNPSPITSDSEVENADVILNQANSNRCFVSNAVAVDTVLVQSAVQFNYCGDGLDDGVVKLSVSSFGPSAASSREKIYTRTLSLSEIILVPFETREEAEEAALKFDAFNDELLEANKKK